MIAGERKPMKNSTPVEGTPAPDAVIARLREAHALLKPQLTDTHPELFRLHFRLHAAIERDDDAYNEFLNRMLHPAGTRRPMDSNRIAMAFYLNEAGKYIQVLWSLFSRRKASRLRPDQRVAECNDYRTLTSIVLNEKDPKVAFEARRKLYLTKLFFDVAHARTILHGDEHRDFFNRRMKAAILIHTAEERDTDVAFNIAADGLHMEYGTEPPLPNQEVWRFHLREIHMLQDGRPVKLHVYFYSCRSKREIMPYRYERGQQIYQLRTVEKWEQLSMRRDASIVSKMLRTGVTAPAAIPDIIGVMFIVENQLEVERLKLALIDTLGGPLKLRNVVDTLNDPSDRARLNRHSGAGYRVYKGEADVLYRPPGTDDPPYTFVVEIQLYTLETYLRTIHADHYASHQRLKRRQLLDGLVPLLFPTEVYGT